MNKFLNITIAGFDELEQLVDTEFTKVISIHDAHLEADGGYERRIKAYFPKARIVFSYFDDVAYLTENGPQEDEIRHLLEFSRQFTKADKILIHCRAGVSRSTALAFAVVCQHTKAGQEKRAFAHICKIRPQLFPNSLIVEMADSILNRKGRLIVVAKTHRWEPLL